MKANNHGNIAEGHQKGKAKQLGEDRSEKVFNQNFLPKKINPVAKNLNDRVLALVKLHNIINLETLKNKEASTQRNIAEPRKELGIGWHLVSRHKNRLKPLIETGIDQTRKENIAEVRAKK